MKKHAKLEEAERQAARIGKLVGDQMPPGWGFLLLLTEYGGEGAMTYVANCHRSSIPQLCRELAFKLEDNRDSLDVDSNYDPHMDRALELLDVLGTVLSGGMFQLHAVGDPGFVQACGGEAEFRKLAATSQEVLSHALKQAHQLIKRLKPELLGDDEPGEVQFVEQGDG